jgi:hypothetical protein
VLERIQDKGIQNPEVEGGLLIDTAKPVYGKMVSTEWRRCGTRRHQR